MIQIPLRYLLGVYYVRMRLLSEPISELIESYARHLQPDVFWKIYETHLELVATKNGWLLTQLLFLVFTIL